MKKSYISILLFGTLLAGLTITLQFFEYRYYIGSLSTDIYTTVVALIFTGLGIWIGLNLLKPKKGVEKKEDTPGIDQSKLAELKLNKREYEILQLIAKGMSNKQIAEQLFIALPTVKTHTSNLYSKLDVKSRTQAVHKAQELHLI